MPAKREQLPPPLPPETRTVGQLVAETIRLYGQRFWASLALGIGPALLVLVGSTFERTIWIPAMATVGGLVLSLSYAGACFVALDAVRGRLLPALAAGVLAFAPVPLLITVFILPAVAWLALVGLVVPVILVERLPLATGFRRAVRLARADYVHALGSLATLAITVILTQGVLVFLLRGAGEQTLRIAAFLASLVVSPLLFLGAALLYLDQAARVVDSRSRTRRKRDADLHHAHDPDRPRRPDAEVEP
jgi:hypothetical protein